MSLHLLLLDWNNICYSKRLNNKSMHEWLLLSIGLVKSNFDECSLDNCGQLGIKGVIKNHLSIVLRAYSKLAKVDFSYLS